MHFKISLFVSMMRFTRFTKNKYSVYANLTLMFYYKKPENPVSLSIKPQLSPKFTSFLLKALHLKRLHFTTWIKLLIFVKSMLKIQRKGLA
ncbi:MAG TPA: hypothetical protein DCK78_22645 [Paenibacillus lactis]|nr:hypothetical protein [Paenibacillus lactis]